MMGHRDKMKGWAEYDASTRFKRLISWRPGERAAIKQNFWRRLRRKDRRAVDRFGRNLGDSA